MSAIHGTGYGDSHDWHYQSSNDSKCSFYSCRACKAFFVHHYGAMPDIFEALKDYGTHGLNPFPDKCPGIKS